MMVGLYIVVAFLTYFVSRVYSIRHKYDYMSEGLPPSIIQGIFWPITLSAVLLACTREYIEKAARFVAHAH